MADASNTATNTVWQYLHSEDQSMPCQLSIRDAPFLGLDGVLMDIALHTTQLILIEAAAIALTIRGHTASSGTILWKTTFLNNPTNSFLDMCMVA